MKKNKAYALKLLNDKLINRMNISYESITQLTGYSRRHLIRLLFEIEKRILNPHSLITQQASLHWTDV